MKKTISTLLVLGMFFTISPQSNAEITYQDTINAIVRIDVIDEAGNQYYGTGFFISNDGVILTAAHVILDETTGLPSSYIDICTIESEIDIPNCQYSGTVMAYDEYFDLALVAPAYRLDENGNEYGDFLDTATMQDIGHLYVDLADYNPGLGDELKILGFPAASLSPTITLTRGIVSGFTPLSAVLGEEFEGYIKDIYTDAIINQGNSGGPAYNEDERVIGVAYAVTLDGQGGNYGYIVNNDVIYLWFLDLVDQGILNEAFVSEVFSNDYAEVDPNLTLPDENDDQTFSDVSETHKNSPAIQYLYDSEIVSGYDDGTFRPNNEINRAELMKMVVDMVIGKPDETKYKNCFPDVHEEWFAPYVCYAKEQGWVAGYNDNTFRPTNQTNRAEAMKIMLNAHFGGGDAIKNMAKNLPTAKLPSDIVTTEWYMNHLKVALATHVLDMTHAQTSGNTYKYLIGNKITRKEVAETLYRLLTTTLLEDDKQTYIYASGELICEMYAIDPSFEDIDVESDEMIELTNEIAKKWGFNDASEMDALAEEYGENDSDLLNLTTNILNDECLGY